MSDGFEPEFEAARYEPGQLLNLFSYTPADPHGTTRYIENPLPSDLPVGWIRGFNPLSASTPDVILKVDRQIKVGVNRRSQVTLCTFDKVPTQHDEKRHAPRRGKSWPQKVVAKSFDTVFYYDFYGISPDERADSHLSIEHAAFTYLYGKELTGYPHLTPEYYGTYVSVFDHGLDDSGRRQFRCVGVMLKQYIDGRSIESICSRPDDGELVPRPMHFTSTDGRNISRIFSDEERKETIRQFLDGAVRLLHVGMEHDDAGPGNVFIAMQNDEGDLSAPWVVMIDYTLAYIWSLTKKAKTNPKYPIHCFQKLPLPPHPWERFSFRALGKFVGWYPFSRYYNLETKQREQEPIFAKELVWCKAGRPVNWDDASEEQRREFKQVPSFIYNKKGKRVVEAEKEFDAWLIDTFGPVVEGSDTGGNYSIFDTLLRIETEEQHTDQPHPTTAVSDTTETSALADPTQAVANVTTQGEDVEMPDSTEAPTAAVTGTETPGISWGADTHEAPRMTSGELFRRINRLPLWTQRHIAEFALQAENTQQEQDEDAAMDDQS